MTFSLNEIEVMGKRAARGAGLSWGLAEETGKAGRWLAERGFPGPKILAELLTRNDGKDYVDLAPVSLDAPWQAPAGRLCPLISGAVMCDIAAEIADGRVVELGAIAYPILLAPYAAAISRLTGSAIELSWGNVTLIFGHDTLSVSGDEADLLHRMAEAVQCRACESTENNHRALTAKKSGDAETWSRLSKFAHRTYAPATEASRLAGAGAGLTDND